MLMLAFIIFLNVLLVYVTDGLIAGCSHLISLFKVCCFSFVLSEVFELSKFSTRDSKFTLDSSLLFPFFDKFKIVFFESTDVL